MCVNDETASSSFYTLQNAQHGKLQLHWKSMPVTGLTGQFNKEHLQEALMGPLISIPIFSLFNRVCNIICIPHVFSKQMRVGAENLL